MFYVSISLRMPSIGHLREPSCTAHKVAASAARKRAVETADLADEKRKRSRACT